MDKTKLVEIYCMVDEFCKQADQYMTTKTLPQDDRPRRRRKPLMSDSEVMTILIMFHLSGHRNLKAFYLGYIKQHCQEEFPKQLSYNRFVERQTSVGIYLLLYLNLFCLGQCTGVSFIDSTPIRVCHIKRVRQHRTLRHWAQIGKSTMGWFYGFKLHIIINDRGEILNFLLTHGAVDDRAPLRRDSFINGLYGKLVADRGYISQDLFEGLFVNGIQMITKKKRNMKNALMHLYDKVLLRQRALVECVNDELKNICQVEHTRHRSIHNFISNLLAGLIAYQTLEKKPSLNLEHIDSQDLVA